MNRYPLIARRLQAAQGPGPTTAEARLYPCLYCGVAPTERCTVASHGWDHPLYMTVVYASRPHVSRWQQAADFRLALTMLADPELHARALELG